MSELRKEFSGKVTPHNVDATLPEAKESIKELGFKSHGIVIRDPSGVALWKQPDHQVRIESVRAALREILGT